MSGQMANHKVTGGMRWADGFWFRVRGWGFMLHRRATHRVYFAERYGDHRWRYVGPVCFRFLTPSQ